MLLLSSRFKQALKYSHVITSSIDVCKAWSPTVLWSSKTSYYGAFLDGEVSISTNPETRRISAQFTDPTGTITPAAANDIFTPYGNELRPYRGIKFADGSVEELPLGVFEMSDVEINDSGEGVSISITGYDRAHTVSTRRPIQDLVVPLGQYYSETIQILLRIVCPEIPLKFFDLPYPTPQLIIKTGEDVWAKCVEMANACGCLLYFDPYGVCTLKSIHVPSTNDVVWNYREGAEATILYTNKRLTNTQAFNYYIVVGENSSNATPVRGDAYDDNPRSPTYWRGPYGTRPAPVMSTKLVTSADQAVAAARGKLQSSIGYAERIHFNALVNPAHEGWDVIQIQRAKSKIDNLYVLDQLSIPLSHNRAMDAVTRVRQSLV